MISFSFSILESNSELSYDDWMLLMLFLVIGLICLALILFSPRIELLKGEIIEKYFFGFYTKRTRRNMFEKYAEVEINNDAGSSRILILIGEKIQFHTSSQMISNYDALKKELTLNLIRDESYESKYLNRLNSIGLGVILLLLFLFIGMKVILN